MTHDDPKTGESLPDELIAKLSGLPWLAILADGWKLLRKVWQGMSDEGMYEVLEYESTLELQDTRGQQALFHKRERVRYRQNNSAP